MNFQYLIVLCSCPDESVAAAIASTLVGEGLAACINRLSAMRSTYAWEGAVRDEPEVLLLIKTRRARYAELERRLRALHPYALPEIIALPVVEGSEAYLAWLGAATGGPAAAGHDAPLAPANLTPRTAPP